MSQLLYSHSYLKNTPISAEKINDVPIYTNAFFHKFQDRMSIIIVVNCSTAWADNASVNHQIYVGTPIIKKHLIN